MSLFRSTVFSIVIFLLFYFISLQNTAFAWCTTDLSSPTCDTLSSYCTCGSPSNGQILCNRFKWDGINFCGPGSYRGLYEQILCSEDDNPCGGGSGPTPTPSPPACDETKLTMEVIPQPIAPGSAGMFRLSGTQGSTFPGDNWYKPDGSAETGDCNGSFPVTWPTTKYCTPASVEGTHKWIHTWRNCAQNNCNITSPLCSKTRDFIVKKEIGPEYKCLGTCRPSSEVAYEDGKYEPCPGGNYPICDAQGNSGDRDCVSKNGAGFLCSGDFQFPPSGGNCNMNINPWGEVRRNSNDRFDVEFTGLASRDENDTHTSTRYNQIAPGAVANYCPDIHSGCLTVGQNDECQGNTRGYQGSFCRSDDGGSNSGRGAYARNFPGLVTWEYGNGTGNDVNRTICCRSNVARQVWEFGNTTNSNCFSCKKVTGTVSAGRVAPEGWITFTFTSEDKYDFPRLHDTTSGDTPVYYDYSSWNNGSFATPHVLNGVKTLIGNDPLYLHDCRTSFSTPGGVNTWIYTCQAPTTLGLHKALFASKQNCESDDITYTVATVPNCSNLKGPASIMLPGSGTYTADHESLLGQLRGNIRAGIGAIVWDPAQTSFPGTTGKTSYTWTPTTAGTYDVFCNSWNDGIAECRGNAWYVSGPLQSLCAGPNASMQVTVIPNCSASPPAPTASEGTFTDRIEVSWSTVPSVLYYDILRNGAVCTSTNDTSFIDTGVSGPCGPITSGTHYIYTIKAVFSSCPSLSGSDTGWTTGPVSLTVNMYIDTNKNGKKESSDAVYDGEGEGINVQIRQIPNFFTGIVTFSGDMLYPSTAGIVPGDFTGSFALRTAGDYRFTGYTITNGTNTFSDDKVDFTSFIIQQGSLPLKETNTIDIGIAEFATGFFQGTGGDIKANTSSITDNIPVLSPLFVMLKEGISSAGVGGTIDTQGGKARSTTSTLDWKQENYPSIPSSDIPTYATIKKYIPSTTPFDCSTGDLPADGIFECNAASSNFTFNNNSGYTGKKVLFIPGDLTIRKDITGNETSGLILIVKGKVAIDKNVRRVDAFIIFEGSFDDTANAGAGEDKKSLTINGGLVGVTSGNGLSSGLKRRQDPNTAPAEIFNLQPAYYTLFANLLGKPTVFWMGE